MDSNHILSLLGLALRGGNLAVGEEPVEAVARARDARVLLLAADAAENTRRRVEHFAEAGQCLWLRLPFTKAELGRAVGRNAAAVAAVTDIGLANAVVHKLAALDPARYDEAAARLELKAKRAAERQAEQRAHEKNVRTGRRKAETAPEARGSGKAAGRPAAKGRRSPSGSPVGKRPLETPASKAGRTPKKPDGKGGRPFEKRSPNPTGGRASSRDGRSGQRNPFPHSRPVKKGKGSFRKKDR